MKGLRVIIVTWSLTKNGKRNDWFFVRLIDSFNYTQTQNKTFHIHSLVWSTFPLSSPLSHPPHLHLAFLSTPNTPTLSAVPLFIENKTIYSLSNRGQCHALGGKWWELCTWYASDLVCDFGNMNDIFPFYGLSCNICRVAGIRMQVAYF